jgi:Ricin-type beta-trefoil lectin domain-like
VEQARALAGVIVARAPVTNPGPGNWKKYFNGSWSEPGLGGNATLLDVGGGTTVARWIAAGETTILGSNPDRVGWGIYVSQDHVHFKRLGVTVLPGDGGTWGRPAPHDVIAYPTLLDASTGENQLGDHWLLAYTYIQPNETFGQRYLVLRPVEVSRSRKADESAGGILLARYYNPTLHDRWSTTAPVPSAGGTAYKVEAKLGYLLTAPDEKRPSIELEECLTKPGQPLDHVLMQREPKPWVCERHDYTRSGTPGFVFTSAQPGTQPLYSCYSEAEKSHFAANREDCEHAGKMETLLGYVLETSLHEGRYQIVSQATRLCFNVRGNANSSGEAIIPYPCRGFTNMQFNFVDQGSGLYSIHTVNGTQDLCLNISTAASSPGDGKKFGGPGNLIQWSCSGQSDNELFRLVDLGGGRQQIRVKHSELCLEDPGSGGTIRQNVCSSSPNQIFTLSE